MKNLEFLGNLNQLLVNAIAHGHMTREECRFDERTAKLRQALEAIVQNPNRPNNSLEAQAALLRIRLNQAMIADELPWCFPMCGGILPLWWKGQMGLESLMPIDWSPS